VTKTLTTRVQDDAVISPTLMRISAVILTFNSELTIGKTLECARRVSDDIHVVDSYSTDNTLQIAESYGARIVQHPFVHYGDQRNWSIDNLAFKYDWQLHLDADEFLSAELIAEIEKLKTASSDAIDGYYIPRLTRFMGRDLRHGGHYPIWHMRLFRSGAGHCESRKYDQHFILTGKGERIHAPMIDDNRMSLEEWIDRHNRWSEAEVQEILHPTTEGVLQGKLRGGSPMQTKRALRGLFLRVPLFARSFLYFVYRYFFLLGFLDGKPGLIYNVLQTFWYRFLIDAKLYEQSLRDGRENR
jgi:glycosyltransferase involved in cell wall biosynthesis